MPYKPFKQTYKKSQAPVIPGSEREFLEGELRRLENALRELQEQIVALQALVPNP